MITTSYALSRAERVWLLFSSFITPNTFGGPGLIDGTSAATSGMDVWAATSWYAPSWVEYAVLLGVIALGALAFLILVERFIMKAKPTDLIDADAAAHGVADAHRGRLGHAHDTGRVCRAPDG